MSRANLICVPSAVTEADVMLGGVTFLPVATGTGGRKSLSVTTTLVVELVWRRDEPLGPAARWLAERFAIHLRAIGGKSR